MYQSAGGVVCIVILQMINQIVMTGHISAAVSLPCKSRYPVMLYCVSISESVVLIADRRACSVGQLRQRTSGSVVGISGKKLSAYVGVGLPVKFIIVQIIVSV